MKNLPTILLAGFAPFDGQALNPSWEAVRALRGKRIAGHRIIVRCLPVAFDASLKELRAALRETSPALVICVGLAGGRERISLERIAINVDDARIPDNDGEQPIDEAIVSHGPAAYFSTLPIKSMLAGLRDAGFPIEVSQTAGTYVCNHVFYGLMHALRNRRKVRAGFIHIPYSPEQAATIAGAPSLDLQSVVAALRLALRIAIGTGTDPRIAAGAEH
ncbi:MAG: pyroglutamyl-peptidase I [Pseudoxanthomonas sp.]